MKRVIFDTDIGIDDAMALLFLHYSADVELLGIVTGFGNADIDTTTRNALFMKERFGIDAPVFRGAPAALGLSIQLLSENLLSQAILHWYLAGVVAWALIIGDNRRPDASTPVESLATRSERVDAEA